MRYSAEIEAVVQRLRDGMAEGVLSFPLTSFRDEIDGGGGHGGGEGGGEGRGSGGGLDLESYRAYLTA
ncbi:5-dehydro-4-deoxyglucarate dehydratase, partial [Streptomyces anthocyanicus]